MNDQRPLVGLQGTSIWLFQDFFTNDNSLWDFSKDRKAEFLSGHIWLHCLDALPFFEKLFRDHTWLILLHGSMSIPRYVLNYMRDYQDSQIDFGSAYSGLIERLNKRTLVDIVDLDTYLTPAKKKEIFEESSNVLYETVSENIDYFVPENRDFSRLLEIASMGDYPLNERVSIALGRPLLYVEGYQKILKYSGAYESLRSLSYAISDYLLPSIPIIVESTDLARVSKSIENRINENIDMIDNIRSSSVGKSFQSLASQVIRNPSKRRHTEEENIESLRKVLKAQKTISRIRKLTFYSVAASGAYGIINPVVGGISLVASVATPLILSRRQARAWRSMDETYPGINYLYQISSDLRSEFKLSKFGQVEGKLRS